MELDARLKLAVKYVYDKCDAVGVWQPNMKLLSFYVGEGVKLEELLAVNDGKLFKDIGEGRVLALGFSEYQYGILKWSCKPHRSYIKMVQKHGLEDQIPIDAPFEEENSKGYVTLSEKSETLSNNSETLSKKTETLSEISERVQEKEKEKEKDKGGYGGKETLWQRRADGGLPLGQIREILLGDALRERTVLWIAHESSGFMLDKEAYIDRVESFMMLAENDPEDYCHQTARQAEKHFRNWLKRNYAPRKIRPENKARGDYFEGMPPHQVEHLKALGYDEFGNRKLQKA